LFQIPRNCERGGEHRGDDQKWKRAFHTVKKD
jgi:hypothetical protein